MRTRERVAVAGRADRGSAQCLVLAILVVEGQRCRSVRVLGVVATVGTRQLDGAMTAGIDTANEGRLNDRAQEDRDREQGPQGTDAGTSHGIRLTRSRACDNSFSL